MYCDWPDTIEEKQNKGKIRLLKKNESIWIVDLNVENIPIQKKIRIEKEFILYKPEYEVNSWDTVNRYDEFRRKQGHWMTEDYFTITNGIYNDNYFTGSKFSFMYYGDKKTLSSVWLFQDNEFKERIKFDIYGKIK